MIDGVLRGADSRAWNAKGFRENASKKNRIQRLIS